MTSKHYDIVVIGAGIAGASVAAGLAAVTDVMLVEAEAQPAYHATGRSAAMFAPSYGPPVIQKFTSASANFFHTPPEGFTETPLLAPCTVLMIGTAKQQNAVTQFIHEMSDSGGIEPVAMSELTAIQPLLREGYAQYGILDRAAYDIDVHALHAAFLKQFKRNGGVLSAASPVQAMTHQDGQWQLTTKRGSITANIVVNAAGAWADEIGQMAGAEKIGLVPKRRTALLIAAPDAAMLDKMPMTIDIDEQFYLKPQAGQLLISPANEDPMQACDVQPEEMDVALCIDRIERAFSLKIEKIISKWAGLRSFVADKQPVIGYSTQAKGFFWLAGQGGYGIQTSPAISHFARSLILDEPLPQSCIDEGLTPEMLCPSRLI